jgi:hypothetical protein
MNKEMSKGSAFQKAAFYLHFLIPLLGTFMCVGGTYAVIQEIINAFADGTIGELILELCLEKGTN